MALVLAFPIAGIAQNSAQTQITPEQVRAAAANALLAGDPNTGLALANALLKRDPRDAEALILKARATRDLGRPREATVSARTAWRVAKSPSERFGASMVMAQALSSSGAKTRSQLWLRRAAQNAPSARFKEVAVRDFRYVQRSNPLATELSFSISPSSNINNGSARSSTRLFDLPFEFQLSGAARALSGMQYSAGLATRYRLFESQRSQHDLVMQLNHRTYTMSAEAKQLAPNARGSDFAFSAAGLSYVRRGFSSSDFSMPNQFAMSFGRTLYGQQPYSDYARVSFTQSYSLSKDAYVFAGASREFQTSLSNRQDSDSWGLNVGLRTRLPSGDRLSFVVNGLQSHSVDDNLDYTQVKFRVRYAIAQPIAGVSVDLGMSVARKSHDTSLFSRFGRDDSEMSFDITGVFRQIEYYGFSPSVTMTATRTNSNIGLFERRDLGLRVGIQSSF